MAVVHGTTKIRKTAGRPTLSMSEQSRIRYPWRVLRVDHWLDRFGDELDCGQCEELLSNLKKTRSWHCCAHGRPTVAPLVNMPALQRVIGLRGCMM